MLVFFVFSWIKDTDICSSWRIAMVIAVLLVSNSSQSHVTTLQHCIVNQCISPQADKSSTVLRSRVSKSDDNMQIAGCIIASPSGCMAHVIIAIPTRRTRDHRRPAYFLSASTIECIGWRMKTGLFICSRSRAGSRCWAIWDIARCESVAHHKIDEFVDLYTPESSKRWPGMGMVVVDVGPIVNQCISFSLWCMFNYRR